MIEVAKRVGVEGAVLGLDISRPQPTSITRSPGPIPPASMTSVARGRSIRSYRRQLLATARQLLKSRQYKNIVLDRSDAQTHAFSPGSYDAVISRLGMSFFADPSNAFANLASALRPAGRLSFTTWQELRENEWMHLPLAAMTEGLPRNLPEIEAGPGPFGCAAPGAVYECLQLSGFGDIRIKPLEMPIWIGTDLEDALEFLLASSNHQSLSQASPEVVRRLTDALRQRLRGRERTEGVFLGSAAWLVTARRDR